MKYIILNVSSMYRALVKVKSVSKYSHGKYDMLFSDWYAVDVDNNDFEPPVCIELGPVVGLLQQNIFGWGEIPSEDDVAKAIKEFIPTGNSGGIIMGLNSLNYLIDDDRKKLLTKIVSLKKKVHLIEFDNDDSAVLYYTVNGGESHVNFIDTRGDI